jgi:hypothetical protein
MNIGELTNSAIVSFSKLNCVTRAMCACASATAVSPFLGNVHVSEVPMRTITLLMFVEVPFVQILAWFYLFDFDIVPFTISAT